MEIKEINGVCFLKITGFSDIGRILIFLPGMGAYKENYITHLSAFKSYYSEIYSIDLPQQGSKGKWTIGNMVSNLREFIAEIDSPDIEFIDLAGHSAGALAIISFLVNYDEVVEQVFFNNLGNDIITLKEKLEDAGFLKKQPVLKKIQNALLYAPPDSFGIVFPKKISNYLKMRSSKSLKIVLNLFINGPLLLLSKFSMHSYHKFTISKRYPQYYKLTLLNHEEFFAYIENYHTLFELKNIIESENLSKVLQGIRVMIQYGSIDWLLKPGYKRQNEIETYYAIHSNVTIKKQHFLGHLFSNKFSLDINLNRQMITNKAVIKDSIEFINYRYGNKGVSFLS